MFLLPVRGKHEAHSRPFRELPELFAGEGLHALAHKTYRKAETPA